jgi:hypothetical protein
MVYCRMVVGKHPVSGLGVGVVPVLFDFFEVFDGGSLMIEVAVEEGDCWGLLLDGAWCEI